METLSFFSPAIAVLEYSKEQRVEVPVPESFKLGDEFDLYGRRWRAVKVLQPANRHLAEATRTLCRSVRDDLPVRWRTFDADLAVYVGTEP
ncbi:MAG TPA: hypothetical protein VGU02_06340 [Gaiellaceae bacterium]|nr:hypothetical protein [Gaiellaceae bacterium]